MNRPTNASLSIRIDYPPRPRWPATHTQHQVPEGSVWTLPSVAAADAGLEEDRAECDGFIEPRVAAGDADLIRLDTAIAKREAAVWLTVATRVIAALFEGQVDDPPAVILVDPPGVPPVGTAAIARPTQSTRRGKEGFTLFAPAADRCPGCRRIWRWQSNRIAVFGVLALTCGLGLGAAIVAGRRR